MIQFHEDIKKKADQIRIEPSSRTWDRLERRLDQDIDKVPIRMVRKWLLVAASAAVILVFSFLLFNHSNSSISQIEELHIAPQATFASYGHAGEFNAIYAENKWQNIMEGSIKNSFIPKKNAADNSYNFKVKEDTI